MNIHSCSYFCERPECTKAQRDELRDKLAQTTADNERMNNLLRSVGWGQGEIDSAAEVVWRLEAKLTALKERCEIAETNNANDNIAFNMLRKEYAELKAKLAKSFEEWLDAIDAEV